MGENAVYQGKHQHDQAQMLYSGNSFSAGPCGHVAIADEKGTSRISRGRAVIHRNTAIPITPEALGYPHVKTKFVIHAESQHS